MQNYCLNQRAHNTQILKSQLFKHTAWFQKEKRTHSVFPTCGMENRARMILQKLPEENRQVSHSQAQPAAAKTLARVSPLPSLLQRSRAFRAAYACSPLEGLEESTGLGPGTGLGSGGGVHWAGSWHGAALWGHPFFPTPDPSGRKTPFINPEVA